MRCFVKFLIALISGLIISVIDLVLTSTYSAQLYNQSSPEVYYGIKAIITTIEEFGILSVAKLFVGKLILYFISNLIGLFIYEKLKSKSNLS